MKTSRLLILLLSACGAAMAHQEHGDSGHDDAIAVVLEGFHQAHSDLDYSKYSSLIAPVFTTVLMNGSINPVDWRAGYSHVPGAAERWTPGAGYENEVLVLKVDVRGERDTRMRYCS